ncbi:MAG: hypothetical protein M3296_05140 [Actinomycetota bacterium]|nr:hypothetical protein [Actinomycetota bacterium]
MSDQHDAQPGWFVAMRQRRRVRRQQALEREFFAREHSGSGPTTASASMDALNAHQRADAYGTLGVGFWAGLGGGGY